MRLAVVIGVLGATAWLACGNDYAGGGPISGERYGACFTNGTCNAGLDCVDGLCVLRADAAGPTEAGGADGGADATDAATPDVAPLSYDGLFGAACQRLKDCLPRDYAVSYADDAACTAASVVPASLHQPYPGRAVATQVAVDDCAAAILRTSCAAFVTGGLPDACLLAGTLPNDAACNFDEQCASRHCLKSGGGCGKCGSPPARLPAGSPCGADKPCDVGLQCLGPVVPSCRAPKETDADCSPSVDNDCRFGLDCDPVVKKCAEPSWLGEGATCATGGDTIFPPCAAGMVCDGESDAKKCRRLGPLGAECGAGCAGPLVCDSSMHCAYPPEPDICK